MLAFALYEMSALKRSFVVSTPGTIVIRMSVVPSSFFVICMSSMSLSAMSSFWIWMVSVKSVVPLPLTLASYFGVT